MKLVDLAILALLVLAVVHGVTQGAALQVLSFGGFWLGLLIGATMSPTVAGLSDGPLGRAFLSLFTLFGVAVLGGALGRILGTQAWTALQRLKLGHLDSVMGAAVAGVAALVAVWLFALLLSAGPTPGVSAAIRESSIVRALVERLPPAPAVFSRIQGLLDESPFPQVFAGLEPRPTEPVALPDDPVVQAAVAAAGPSTTKIVGIGCGGVQSGSGFVARPNLVVTNAHVVAGIERPTVETRTGNRHDAIVVVFDPNLDVAVLRTNDLSAPPLAIAPATVDRGTGGAVIGYPGGGPFTAGAGAVLRQFEAVGRDIYGSNVTSRDVYQLQARVRQGNSGGPFVRDSGEVLGVIFAASTTDQSIGYALTTPEVLPHIEQASGRSQAVDTGPCTT